MDLFSLIITAFKHNLDVFLFFFAVCFLVEREAFMSVILIGWRNGWILILKMYYQLSEFSQKTEKFGFTGTVPLPLKRQDALVRAIAGIPFADGEIGSEEKISGLEIVSCRVDQFPLAQ